MIATLERDAASRSMFDIAHDFLVLQRSRYWFSRGYICMDVLVTAWLAVFGGLTLNRVAIVDLPFGLVALASMVVFASLGLADLVINDLMPQRYAFAWARRNRWVLYMGLSLTMGALIFANARNPDAFGIMARYLLECVGAFALAFFDIAERGPGLERRKH